MIMMSTTNFNLLEQETLNANNQIKVIWQDTLDNHSNVREREIQKYFQNKYKTDKVKVVFTPIMSKNSSVVAEGAADASELVLDDNYQKQLIEQYIKDNDIKISIPHLMKLDESVNVDLDNYKEHTNRYKMFKIREIEFSNFLSYGNNNKLVFDDKKGVVTVISEPANYGGKTTLTVDLLLFLFFGTTTKSEKNEDIFNRYTNSDTVEVKGKVDIEGNTYIINRTISRKLTKNGYVCKGSVDFYQIVPTGGIIKLNGEQRKFTDDLIKTYVGNYDDFLITILTTGDNLDDLIKTKPTERARILTRFIGLEFFREKEKIAKNKYAEWKEKSKLYHNNSQDILSKIEVENNKIEETNFLIQSQINIELDYVNKINDVNKSLDDLFKSRHNDIDVELYKLDEETIQAGINKVNGLITNKELEMRNLQSSTPKPTQEYDIDFYGKLTSKLKELNETKIALNYDTLKLKEHVNMLKTSEICQTCKRRLDDVDHTKEVAEKEETIAANQSRYNELIVEIGEVEADLKRMDEIKKMWDVYNKNELLIEKCNIELNSFKESLNRGVEKLNKYNRFKDMVEKNKLIDTDIQTLKYKLNGLNDSKNMASLQIKGYEKDIESAKRKIDDYNNLLVELKNDEKIDKIFKTYLDVYGKNGISKMVLGTMIPLINSHLKILLSDSSEFVLEIRINEKNEIEFWMVDQLTEIEKPLSSGSGYEKTISSLALRCVLSKVCSLPKPNIIIFDEVTGKVSNDNLDKVGLFFDKLKQFFEHIWVISHNPLVQDWGNHLVKVKKEDNISTVA